MKRLWIIANWKSNKTIQEALEWISIVGPKLEREEELKVVVCPTFSALSEVKKAIQVANFPLLVGSQDLSPFGVGAYTGEEPAEILKQFVDLAIIGHSERRFNFRETEREVEQKVERANESEIISLVCVQKEETPVPSGCKMIAYEPISAISTGLTNTPGVGKVDNPDSANEVAKYFKNKYSDKLEVIYGGSVDSKNVKGFFEADAIDGVLVGNASLDANEFVEIVNQCKI